MREIDDNKIYTLEETVEILRVAKSTLRSWDRSGYFVAGRTKGKHRRYTGKQIKEMLLKMFSTEDKQAI